MASSTNRITSLPSPQVTLEGGRAPRSERFHDTYFDRTDGLAESRHVFLAGCGLPDAWQNANSFVIGETGFGTGLNFLAVWDLWRRTRPTNGLLHYLSIDGFPLTVDEIEACLEPIRELKLFRQRLTREYPLPQRGFHRCFFDDDGVILTLIFDDVKKALSDLSATVDAWFLDGFAPAKNPAMWTSSVLSRVAQLSKPGTKVATFSVAGAVKQELAKAGFGISKRSGAGRKREVLSGVFEGNGSVTSADQPWFERPPSALRNGARVTVIGGGLAGAHTARAFSRRGCSVRVIDAENRLCTGASAAPGAIVMPRISLGQGSEEIFYAQAWRHAYSALCDANDVLGSSVFDPCGVVACALSEEEHDRSRTLIESGHGPAGGNVLVSADAASDIAGLTLSHPAIHIPDAGMTNGKLLCDWLTRSVDRQVSFRVDTIDFDKGVWRVADQEADIVVLANGVAASSFPEASELPLSPRLGQITALVPTTASKHLGAILVGDVHLTPPVAGHHFGGATFDHVARDIKVDLPIEPDAQADRRNLNGVESLLPGMFTDTAINGTESWAGLRCVTPDHLPMAGPVPDHAAYKSAYADLHHGRHWKTYPPAQYHQGLFTLTGLGARGHLTAPLAAELVVSQALGEPLPVPRAVSDVLHPSRFVIRSLQRPPSVSRQD